YLTDTPSARTVRPSCDRARRQGRLQEALHPAGSDRGVAGPQSQVPGIRPKRTECLQDRPPGAAAGGSPTFWPEQSRRLRLRDWGSALCAERARAEPARSWLARSATVLDSPCRGAFAIAARIGSPAVSAASPALTSGLGFL